MRSHTPSLLTVFLMLSACYPASAEPAASATATPSASLAGVGDILLDRGVGAKVEQFGYDYPFAKVSSLLSASDIVFGNLECPLSAHGNRTRKRFSFKVPPDRVVCLKRGGLTILSAANNHSMDCGREGLQETMAALKSQGLSWCGAGDNKGQAESPTIITRNGLRIAFVGFCQFLPEGTFLNNDRPTIAFADEDNVKRAVGEARRKADIVVASFHWGIEYRTWPSDFQKHLAHVAVAAGADLVLGHHPHVLEGSEALTRIDNGVTHEAFIVYSLGNFVFDPKPEQGIAAATSMIFRCRLTATGVRDIHTTPIRIVGCRPLPIS